MNIKKCKDCANEYPETRDYFGQYKNQRKGVVKIGFRSSCRKCMAKRTATHSANNPDMVRERLTRRMIRNMEAQGSYSQVQINTLRAELGDRCRFCGSELNGLGDIEHLTPISRGGSNNIQNLTLSCSKCNKEKTNKTLSEYQSWRVERGMKNRKRVKVSTEQPDKVLHKR